jgi:hypothetical protein
MYVDSNQKDWDIFLPAVLFAHRASPATKSTGHSPFMLLYGREPTLPLDVQLTVSQKYPSTARDHLSLLIQKLEVARSAAIEKLTSYKEKMKQQSDKSVLVKDFKIGDAVFVYTPKVKLHTSKKLSMLWTGPYIITEQVSDVLFKLRRLSDNKAVSVPVHMNRFKQATAFRERPKHDLDSKLEKPPSEIFEIELTIPDTELEIPTDNVLPPNLTKHPCELDPVENEFIDVGLPEIISAGEQKSENELFEVEKVIRGRYRNGKLEYLIKWKNYPSSANTWEPEHNLNETLLQSLKDSPVNILGKRTCCILTV